MDKDAKKVLESYHLTGDETLSLASEILQVLDGPVARYIEKLLARGAYDKIVNLSWDPYLRTYDDFLAINLLKKFPFTHPNLKPTEKALQTFLKSEEKCKQTNDYLSAPSRWDGRDALLYYAQSRIAEVLGELSEQELVDGFTMGSHAAIGASGKDAHKLVHMARLSYWDRDGALRCRLYDVVAMRGVALTAAPASRVEFVPKTAKTDRTICVEPSLNLAWQLAIGNVMRSRLRKIGIDLTDQSKNQRLACLGAIRGDRDGFATIDLSSASDSIAKGLVDDLFARCPDWLNAMYEARVPQTLLPNGEVIVLEKFSSMGNGYTFPLETLIFYALTYATADRLGVADSLTPFNTAFYGDDIVIPTGLFKEVCKTLEQFGFTINRGKSYAETNYRESCGVHALGASKMRPLYIRDSLTRLPDVYRIINTLFAIAVEEAHGSGAHGRWQSVIRKCIRALPKTARMVSIPLMRMPGEIYQVSIVNFALYDLQFEMGPFRFGSDGKANGIRGAEGWFVNGVALTGRRVVGWKGKVDEEKYTLNPLNANAVMRLLLYQVDTASPGTTVEAFKDITRMLRPLNPDLYSKVWGSTALAPSTTSGSVSAFTARTEVFRIKVQTVFVNAVFAVRRLKWLNFS